MAPLRTIRSILDAKVSPQALVDVTGIVKDFRPPFKTKGQDFKATIKLYDSSVDGNLDYLEFALFLPENEMPEVGVGDIVYAKQCKVQRRYANGPMGILTNYSTRIYVFEASRIPNPPASASVALRRLPRAMRSAPPTKDILQHVSTFYHTVNKDALPDADAFNLLKSQAANVKQKYRELKDVEEWGFCDLVVQVVKPPYDQGDCLTLWVSDYTENPAFFHFRDDATPSEGVYVDTDGLGTQGGGWEGPLGKFSMQITCWDPHAAAIRGKVDSGAFMSLRNVQIKYGKSGNNMEGFLREDQKYPKRVQCDVLKPHDDPENMDPIVESLLRRKRDYEREQKRRRKQPESDAGPKKRKPEEADTQPPPRNSKRRRAEQRARLQAEEQRAKRELESVELNPDISCETAEALLTPISSMLEPLYYNLSTSDGQDSIRVTLPFNNARYRTTARVTDYYPAKLEDFAVSRKVTEYDALSDAEGGDGSDESSVDEEDGTLNAFHDRVWEWRFALELEDISPQVGQKRARLFVHVDNAEAQFLTGLDASNLRDDPQGLVNLRAQMAKLWGNLEEQKLRLLPYRSEKGHREAQGSPHDKDDFPQDSSPPEVLQRPGGDRPDTGHAVQNKVFSCCIRQFGVRVAEDDPKKADAGEGRRWVRRFGLFGTKISYPEMPDDSD